MNNYLIDANVFIQAKNMHYGFDFCPAFWEWLLSKNDAGIVFSIDKVEAELKAGSDELSAWASENGKFFRNLDSTVTPALGKIAEWAQKKYEGPAVSTFFQAADFFLTAYASVHQVVIVTHEVASPSVRRIKIPNVCLEFNIKFMTPYTMLRTERARFLLAQPTRK